jgi:hypothetical protein
VKQAGPIELCIAEMVRDPSTGERIGSRLNAFEGEAKLLSYSPAWPDFRRGDFDS